MHLLCPHCKNAIELLKLDASAEITCESCGSSFRLAEGSTTGWAAPPGEHIGRFTLLETLGHGAFGTVYKAKDPELDRTVAVKVPRRGNIGEGQHEIDRFLREARSAAQLRHPAIVTVHEVGVQEGRPYLVSDFVEGVTLADYMTAQLPTHKDAARILAEIADALEHAHSLGVVHRDVKPANIMVRPDGSPVVMDFGLAKREAGEITMTIDGQVLGTPAYMSPEQARGEGHRVDGRSDIYSLGVVLYRLLTGELPFHGNSRMLLHQVLHDEPKPLRALNDKIPRDLETIALKAMAKEPTRRYASAKELADDLRRFLGNQVILARPVGPFEKARRWCRRNPVVAGLCTAIAATLLAGTVVSTLFALQAKSRARDAEKAQLRADQERDGAVEARQREEQLRTASRRRAAAYALETGSLLCEQGEIDRGLHWFARAFRDITPNDRDLDFEARCNLAEWRNRTLSLRAVGQHGSEYRTIAYGRNGKSLLTANMDRTARLWNGETGDPLCDPLKHSHQVEAATISADGTHVLTGCFDGTLRLWSVDEARLLANPVVLKSLIREVELRPNGRSAWARTNGGEIFFIADMLAEQPDPQAIKPGGKFVSMAMNPEGSVVATGDKDGVRLWNAADASAIGEAILKGSMVGTLAFSPDGALLAAAASAAEKKGVDSVRLWDMKNRTELAAVPHGSIRDLAFSPDGKFLATASNDGTARVFALGSSPRLRFLPIIHRGQVSQVAFSPDGKLLYSASQSTMYIWDASSGKSVGPPRRDAGQFAIRPDGKAIAAGSLDGDLRFWELQSYTTLPQRIAHENLIRATAFSRDGTLLASGDQQGLIRLWSLTNDKLQGEPMRHTGTIDAIALSADGKLLASAGWDNSARVWNTKDGSPRGEPLKHPEAVHCTAFHGGQLITGCNDGDIRFWDLQTNKQDGDALKHTGSVRQMALSPDRRLLAVAGLGSKISLWELEGRKALPPISHQGRGGVSVLAFSMDGKQLLTTFDKSAFLWDTATWKQISRFDGHERGIEHAVFSPDGKQLLTGSYDGTARLWDIEKGQTIASFGHESAVLCVAFSADGRMILTGSEDNTARLWSAETFRTLGPRIRHQGDVSQVGFSPDSQTMFSASGAVRLARIGREELPADELGTQIETWTGAKLGDDGSFRMTSAKSLGKIATPRKVLSISALRDAGQDEPGPFGRAHLSGRSSR